MTVVTARKSLGSVIYWAHEHLEAITSWTASISRKAQDMRSIEDASCLKLCKFCVCAWFLRP